MKETSSAHDQRIFIFEEIKGEKKRKKMRGHVSSRYIYIYIYIFTLIDSF